MNKLLKIFLSMMLLGVVSILSLNIYFYFIDYNSIIKTKSKIWAHRTNSIDSIEKAILKEVGGVEIDIFYSEQYNRFVITRNNKDTLKEDNLVLEDVLKRFSNEDTYFWLDFHRLEFLSIDEQQKAFEKLVFLSDKYNIKNKIVLESQSSRHLKRYTKNGFFTISLYSFGDNESSLKKLYREYRFKISYVLNQNFSGFSVDQNQYGQLFDKFTNIPVFIFTVNDTKKIEKYKRLDNIKVILTDKY
ncbi:hypothetical protein ALC152_14530 [Arcobacter sp. 15-2]|uniref:hypothetical protein n=1 Tax=Arcobacter sp. 15-2 TaxID=3374109 RepID=UPI00399CB442